MSNTQGYAPTLCLLPAPLYGWSSFIIYCRLTYTCLRLFAPPPRLRLRIDSVFPLDEASEAHARMEANLNTGKIILSVDETPAHAEL